MRVRRFLACWVAAVLASTLTMGTAASAQGATHTTTGCEEHTDSLARLYVAAFGRQPEAAGFAFWFGEYTSGRWSLPDMAVFFTESRELQLTYGTLDDRQFITQIYRNVLGRGPDLGGLEFWAGEMSNGMTRGTLLLRFSESPENVARSGTEIPQLGYYNEGLRGPWGADLLATCNNVVPQGGCSDTDPARLPCTPEVLVTSVHASMGGANPARLLLLVPNRRDRDLLLSEPASFWEPGRCFVSGGSRFCGLWDADGLPFLMTLYYDVTANGLRVSTVTIDSTH